MISANILSINNNGSSMSILEQEALYLETTDNIIILILVSFTVIFAVLCILFGMFKDNSKLCILFFTFAMICLIGTIFAPTIKIKVGNKYKVLIDDNYPFVEFYEKYEVIDKNGIIWTIKDKENTE